MNKSVFPLIRFNQNEKRLTIKFMRIQDFLTVNPDFSELKCNGVFLFCHVNASLQSNTNIENPTKLELNTIMFLLWFLRLRTCIANKRNPKWRCADFFCLLFFLRNVVFLFLSCIMHNNVLKHGSLAAFKWDQQSPLGKVKFVSFYIRFPFGIKI